MTQRHQDSPILVGVRVSQLAMHRADAVLAALREAGVEDLALHVLNAESGQRTWSGVAGLRRALTEGECDAAVHSAKELPLAPVKGLRIAAYLPRFDAREALVARDGLTLTELPHAAKVGVGSTRRRGQLLLQRPDLEILEARGNVAARIARVRAGELDAVIVALDGLDHLGLHDEVSQILGPELFLPAPGQAAVIVECRTAGTPPELVEGLRRIDHLPTRLAVTAERAFAAALPQLADLGVAAQARLEGEAAPWRLQLDAMVVRPDASDSARVSVSTQVGDASQHEGLLEAIKTAEGLGEEAAAEVVAKGGARLFRAEHVHAVPRVLYPAPDPDLGEAISALGGEGVAVDLIRHVEATPEYLDTVTEVLRSVDQVGIASAESVRVLAGHAERRGMALADLIGGTPVVAIGSGAAAALVAQSVTVDLVPFPDSGIGALIDAWPAPPAGVTDPKAALACSARVTPRLAKGLREDGWQVEVLPIYDTVTAQRTPEHDAAIADGWPEVVIVVSATTAKAVIDLFGMPPAEVRICAVGQMAARDARALGLTVEVVSPSTKPETVASAALNGLVRPAVA